MLIEEVGMQRRHKSDLRSQSPFKRAWEDAVRSMPPWYPPYIYCRIFFLYECGHYRAAILNGTSAMTIYSQLCSDMALNFGRRLHLQATNLRYPNAPIDYELEESEVSEDEVAMHGARLTRSTRPCRTQMNDWGVYLVQRGAPNLI